MKRFITSTIALATTLYYGEAVLDPWMSVSAGAALLWALSITLAVATWSGKPRAKKGRPNINKAFPS